MMDIEHKCSSLSSNSGALRWMVANSRKCGGNLSSTYSERESLHHPPRSLSKHPHSEMFNISLINFYDAFAPMEKSQNLGSIPLRAAELITKMNRHPRFLSLLGILPNQFRTLLKELGFQNREEAISDLARTLFFAGFSIWSKRQKMASSLWK